MLPYFWKEIQIEWWEDLDDYDYEHVATILAFFPLGAVRR